jgi:hypothetical protein
LRTPYSWLANLKPPGCTGSGHEENFTPPGKVMQTKCRQDGATEA